MDWKNKYLKYKLKYAKLKTHIEFNKNIYLLEGGDVNKNVSGHYDQGHRDQGYGDQGHSDQGYGDQGYGDQGYGDQYLETNSDDTNIFSKLISDNLKKGIWDKKTILLDCIGSTGMQTETNKLINYICSSNIVNPNKKHLEMSLVYAVYCGYYIVVEELIKLGANPNIQYNGFALADTAINFCFFKTAKVLMNHGGLSKNFYSSNQLIGDQYNFSNDPENFVKSPNTNKPNQIDEQIYRQFKEKLLTNSLFNFENLNTNILKTKFKKNIKIN